VSVAGGYSLVASDGGIFTYGDAGFYGSAGALPLNKPIVGMASTPDGKGYWLVASDGGIFTYGDAGFYGSAGALPLNKPIVGMASTPDGKGYWLVASDGGIFTYGDAGFYGSAGALPLNKPIVGMASTPDGKGYWLVASDGGIFTYGDAGFYGSAGALPLNKPIVGMASTPDGKGYWLVASDGGIFTYGDAGFYGSAGALPLNKPIVGMASTPDGKGYWLVASDGGIFTYGDAGFYGSAGSIPLNKPIVGMIVPSSSAPSTSVGGTPTTPLGNSTLAVTTTSISGAVVGLNYSFQLGASGGVGGYTWGGSGLPPGLALSSTGVISGIPLAYGVFTISLSVVDASGVSASSSLPMVVGNRSTNWAGYIASGSGFTGVSATFNVPAIPSALPANCNLGTPGQVSQNCASSVWVGVDGYPSSNQNLIQAGIAEQPVVGSNQVQLYAWWEVLPASATPISSINVSPGDSVAVSISQVSGGQWQINVTDTTNGESFSTVSSYSGPASSAEWIVEAPQINGSVATLTPFSDVKFVNASRSTSATLNSLIPFDMYQGGSLVASPGPISSSGSFTVSYF
ncbi:unnamed protein product, partial [Acidithrix sp. C25]